MDCEDSEDEENEDEEEDEEEDSPNEANNEEDNSEDDEAEEGDGNEEDAWQGDEGELPMDPYELHEMIWELRGQILSLRQKARAKNHRRSHTLSKPHAIGPLTRERVKERALQREKAEIKRVERAVH